jgi:hypothetical protein
MRLGKDLLDKPIISLTDGRNVGKVKDLYLDEQLEKITALYLGSEVFSAPLDGPTRPHFLLGLTMRRSDVVEETQVAEGATGCGGRI